MRETWYVLEDGKIVDPAEVAPDDTGVLTHSSGVAVSYRNGVPVSYGVDPDEERAKASRPEPEKRGYKTRESKAK